MAGYFLTKISRHIMQCAYCITRRVALFPLAISNYIEKYGLMYWHMHRRNSSHMNKRLYEATKCEICETLAFVDLHAVNQ